MLNQGGEDQGCHLELPTPRSVFDNEREEEDANNLVESMQINGIYLSICLST
jgi:hypothetical protein